ncbi:hypothetical protein [Nannocystis punicea]|uniref:Uncharacterized protein n=1 Tax=Nannocystis punicea TaxID=2995304 RepID=A0ABY7H3C2_9BACT|nr:hypothetical protein [Nannocystis poenicansa]WAS93617.1 hypothetical protein O0S08_46390 [Nannocystis poenicansa]
MRLRSLLLISSIGLGACSTAAPQSETLGNSTASASNTDGTSDTGGQASAGSTESPGTTLDPTAASGTTSATTAPTATGATAEGETSPTSTAAPTTDTTSATTDTTSATTDTTFEPGDTDTDTTGWTDTDTTGGPGGGACEVDADCKLHDDCCSCYGIPNEQTDPICKAECEQTQCEQIGIDEAKCVLGECTTEKVDCSSEVACDSLPPDCPPGTLPGIAGACWSGACVPAVSCDKVPDCKSCPDSLMCVQFQAFINEHTCLPLPTECNGKASCECAAEACVEPFGFCGEGAGDVDLACACPAC